MTVGDHRLAAGQAMDAAEAAEQAREDTHTPAGGGDPGVSLAGASAEELASLGMSPGVEVPAVGPLQQPPPLPAGAPAEMYGVVPDGGDGP